MQTDSISNTIVLPKPHEPIVSRRNKLELKIKLCLHNRLTPAQSLINAHIYPPQCVDSALQDPPQCQCGNVVSMCDIIPTTPGPLIALKSYVARRAYDCFSDRYEGIILMEYLLPHVIVFLIWLQTIKNLIINLLKLTID